MQLPGRWREGARGQGVLASSSWTSGLWLYGGDLPVSYHAGLAMESGTLRSGVTLPGCSSLRPSLQGSGGFSAMQ